ncbi:hypothetical protein J1N35_021294 [Gossypium stocksii]|uniref:Uncharacterized protein n=1 Tax=Gossypium stocksii TaxID=47602 RepID=A0A9D4A163_9ROSI|nr:hypothetical protein J1N35_021294 [Gossypium stocksii]
MDRSVPTAKDEAGYSTGALQCGKRWFLFADVFDFKFIVLPIYTYTQTCIGSKLDGFQHYWNVNNVEAVIMDRKYASRLLYYKTKSGSSLFCNSVAELLRARCNKKYSRM